MSFTFDLTNGFTDLARVRFHVGDTDENAPIFSDEEITAFLVEFETWEATVRACFNWIITTLTRTPNFQADWLKVDVANTVKLMQAGLAVFEARYGDTVSLDMDAVHTYRADSHATSVSYDGT